MNTIITKVPLKCLDKERKDNPVNLLLDLTNITDKAALVQANQTGMEALKLWQRGYKYFTKTDTWTYDLLGKHALLRVRRSWCAKLAHTQSLLIHVLLNGIWFQVSKADHTTLITRYQSVTDKTAKSADWIRSRNGLVRVRLTIGAKLNLLSSVIDQRCRRA